MMPTEPMTLREAARRTSRSITTLRRYIRSGRLAAAKRSGRFGPEYFVTARDLAAAGLPAPDGDALVAPSTAGGLSAPAAERILREAVPATLYQELQMKHEQLLVQYGMMRAGGLAALDLRAELERTRRDAEEARAAGERLRLERAREVAELRQRLRETELEMEQRRLEADALRSKVRALEGLTRHAAPAEDLDEQLRQVIDQARKIERLRSALSPARTTDEHPEDAGH